MVIKMNEGISIVNNQIIYNTDGDSENDIMNIVYPDIYNSEFLGNVYYFGYRFNDNASRQDRTTIIHWLKGIDKNDCIDNKSLSKFIQKPLIKLNEEENLSSFSAIIYTRSNRSDLTLQINKEIGALTQHHTDKISYELIKNITNNICFDWEQNRKLLIVDDINTRGVTLTEILRIIKAINNEAQIYIFTLIGK